MTERPPDPYALLGVTVDASGDDLDRAFRRLVRRLHPDTRGMPESDEYADQRLQELLTAYATLRDPIRRTAYDRTRPAPTNNVRIRRTYGAQPEATDPTRPEPAIRLGPVYWEPSRPPSSR
ncbi:J domain-containing protein [Kribbella sp. NPDC026611]|uniref:J domain-containing protein n=1 Tax=Kribbella sp. NPDC026611 TaxID=3154911 RepID=UPI0033F08B45